MNNNTILALVFLVAGALLTVGAIAMPAAYAGGDHDGGDGNKQKAEDESAAAIADCDENDVERAGFDCFGIAANDIEADIGGLLEGLGTEVPETATAIETP